MDTISTIAQLKQHSVLDNLNISDLQISAGRSKFGPLYRFVLLDDNNSVLEKVCQNWTLLLGQGRQHSFHWKNSNIWLDAQVLTKSTKLCHWPYLLLNGRVRWFGLHTQETSEFRALLWRKTMPGKWCSKKGMPTGDNSGNVKSTSKMQI